MALSSLLAACGGTAKLLPHSVYYRDGLEEELQVWRLEADGFTTVQITDETAGVQDFAVSPADGSLAFVSNNQLFLVDGDGENRRLVADDSQVDKEGEDYSFRGFIEAPVFSPDGRTLAYAFDGLHLYNLASGEDEHVLTNLGNLPGEPFVFAKENYFPGPWSPDGSKLLIIMGYFEGSTLAVMDLEAAQPFTRLYSDGPACCLFNWAADGRSVLVANPHYAGQRPGLWSYDVETGEETVLILGPAGGGSDEYVGWPQQLTSGDLVYFHVSLERFSPEVGIPLVMVQSDPDRSDRTQLRPEVFQIAQALWAQDGSLALILQRGRGDSWQVVLAPTDGSPLQALIEGERIMDLAWGP
jgi:Tol biopolymer transport system component